MQLRCGRLRIAEKLPDLLLGLRPGRNDRILLDIDKPWQETLLVKMKVGRKCANLIDAEVVDTTLTLALEEVVFKLLLTHAEWLYVIYDFVLVYHAASRLAECWDLPVYEISTSSPAAMGISALKMASLPTN
jgi:hypothetical protein